MDANRAGGNMVWALQQLAGDDFGFDPHGTKLDRTEAVTKAFKWWT